MSLYQSLGSSIVDEQGLPGLEAEPTTRLLSFFDQARRDELFPAGIETFQDDAQAWQAYNEMRANLVITWLSRYL